MKLTGIKNLCDDCVIAKPKRENVESSVEDVCFFVDKMSLLTDLPFLGEIYPL
jgi:hypothetical protein